MPTDTRQEMGRGRQRGISAHLPQELELSGAKERMMSAQIRQELESRGVAEVIVILKGMPPTPPASASRNVPTGTAAALTGGAAAGELEKYFVSSERSQVSALAFAAQEGRPLRAGTRAGLAKADARVLPPPAARYYPNLGVMLGTVNRSGLQALQGDAQVAAVVGTPMLSLIRPLSVAKASLRRAVTWGIEAMKVPTLWRKGISGKGILVGHLDTGVDGKHPALRKAIQVFAEFDELGQEITPAPKPYDTDSHGTHTAATIAGRPVSRRHVGVAPKAMLVSAIVIEGGNVVARVLGGMDWAVGHNVRILSMSLGFRGWWEDFRPLTQILRARNILPVFAVGNEGPGTSRSPGNYVEALSVGAHDSTSRVARFSSSQSFQRPEDSVVPDLVAPGTDVISASPGGGYQAMDGTSMATPHVAGLAALLMEAKPNRAADEIEAAIFGSCTRPPGMSPYRGNRGIPDAVVALSSL